MTRDQLDAARDVLNLSALSREVGLTRSYLRTYLDAGRELPSDVQARLDDVMRARGLEPQEGEPAADEASDERGR